MSRHIGRKQRWTQENSIRYTSSLGTVVYEQHAWYALLDYKTSVPPERAGELRTWLSHRVRLGPFKRPRNAMVALEREATLLQNRYGENFLLGDQLWAEA